jgi:hypothetical protein
MNRPSDILRAEAVRLLEGEKTSPGTPGGKRWFTRQQLFERAEHLGFDARTEASARVDEALTAAGTTP